MFSALTFVAAAAIVVLFGGFLLSGVLTTQPDDEPAPAAVTESATTGSRDPAIVAGRMVGGTQTGLAKVKYDRDDPDTQSVEVSIPLDDRGQKTRELNELLKKKQ